MSGLALSDFDYELPPDRIAQVPAARRDAARLMVLRVPALHAPEDRLVSDLPELLRPGDLLIINDTRVFPARFQARKESGGRVEILLLAKQEAASPGAQTWEAMLGASRMPGAGQKLLLGARLSATVLREPVDGVAPLALESEGGVEEAIERLGEVPLPPYIHRNPAAGHAEDRERYQTVYARHTGAAAAPTAGLHFTDDLLGQIEAAGVGIAALTLHVGLGTFQPVREERIERHRMHAERFRIPEGTARAVKETRGRGGRVVAVGTTVLRALEHAGRAGEVLPGEGWCDLFITPGFTFRHTDLLLTNFHLPRTTLLMLVSAFAGRERILRCYSEAIARGYRFYSYGDAMLIERHTGER